MKRLFVASLVVLAAHAGDSRQPAQFDFEPSQNLETSPLSPAITDQQPAMSPSERIVQCENMLQRAEKRAAEAEPLFREGILARVEVEDRARRVIKARKELADARLASAQSEAEALHKARRVSRSDLEVADAAAARARRDADSADDDWHAAQLLAAQIDIQRKRTLYRQGVGTRREVEQAEEHLALLTGTSPEKKASTPAGANTPAQ